MKALFDHNLSPRLARCLQALMGNDHEIVALRDRFDMNIKDIDLITRLSEEGGWILVSGDRRITKNKAEKSVFRNSRVVGMFLSKSLYEANIMVQAQRLIVLWPAIETIAANVKGGSMFELPIKSTKLSPIK